MNIEESHLVVLSPCGSTLNCLRVMSDYLPNPLLGHDLTLPATTQQSRSFGPEDLVVLGFPVYGGRLPSLAGRVFKSIAGNKTPVVLVAVYGNRDYEDALLEMQQLAEERGFVPFAAAALVAEHVMEPSVGSKRPDGQDKKAIRKFAKAVCKSISTYKSVDEISFTAPGQYPFRKPVLRLPFAPVTLKTCRGCALCVDICPAEAIQDDAARTADPEICISCMACVLKCPKKARVIDHPALLNAKQWLSANCIERREPEFFLKELV